MAKWLEFRKEPQGSEKKTDRFFVTNSSNGTTIGKIEWYGGFRKYVFSPYPDVVLDADCLREIASYLNILMLERKVDQQNGK